MGLEVTQPTAMRGRQTTDCVESQLENTNQPAVDD